MSLQVDGNKQAGKTTQTKTNRTNQSAKTTKTAQNKQAEKTTKPNPNKEVKNQYKGVGDSELTIIGELIDQEYEITKARMETGDYSEATVKKFEELKHERQLIINEFTLRQKEAKQKKIDVKY